MNARTLLLLAAVLLVPAASAAEVSTNGLGGGPWTDPSTWRGKAVPGPGDEVVLRKHDVVIYDRPDDGKPACRKLQIDPRGGLTFKTGAGRLVLAVTEGIETFGVIRLDGTKSASDQLELRLQGDTPTGRQIKVGKGGGLLLFGRPDLPRERHNVVLAARAADPKEDVAGLVEAEGTVLIDWRQADVEGVKLSANKIDNTGVRPNEGLRVKHCRFSGQGRVLCQGCDTPEITHNTFSFREGALAIQEGAIHLSQCPLAEVKGNRVRGPITFGIVLATQSDSVVTDNTVEKCTYGLSAGAVTNLMLKDMTARGCDTGIRMTEGTTGVVEDSVVRGATTAYLQSTATLQISGLQVKDLAPKGVAVQCESGSVSLLNCNIPPAQIKVLPQAPAAAGPVVVPVTCQAYVVVSVKGAPKGSLVDVQTTNPAPPAGAADPNVRNSPAALAAGRTPLPKTVSPLIVKSWTFDPTGKLVPAPDYAVKVLGPAPKEGAPRPLLKAVPFKPAENAFRASPDDPKPTVEVPLK
jgi:hypothetical protein